MIDIGSTEFHIDAIKLPREELERYTDELFDSWESYIPRTVTLDDYSLVLEIEEGSIKGVGKIFASLAAVYGAIAGYGSFVQGLQIIHGQVVSVGDYLTSHAISGVSDPTANHSIKRKGGSLGQLQKLFNQVQRNEKTVDQAMSDAKGILGDEADSVPEFMNRMNEALKEVPKNASQISLLSDDFDVETKQDNNSESSARKKRPQTPIPDKTILRIEIVRESKGADKKRRITENRKSRI